MEPKRWMRLTAMLFSLPFLLILSFTLLHLSLEDSTIPFQLLHYVEEVIQKFKFGFVSLRKQRGLVQWLNWTESSLMFVNAPTL